MNNVYEISPRDIRGEASDWLVKIDRGLKPEEQDALAEWLSEESHYNALIEVAGLWDKMESLSRLADLFPQSTVAEEVSEPSPGFFSFKPVTAFAVSLFVLITAALFIYNGADMFGEQTLIAESHPGYKEVFETAVGETSTVNLPDGSELTLNTNTHVTVEFDQKSRYIKLDQGEIYVKVSKDKSRPLDVRAFDRVVRAVGTEFNIEIKDEHLVELIVTEGKVLVGVVQAAKSTDKVLDSGILSDEESSVVQKGLPVLAGEQLLMSEQGQAAEQIQSKEIDVKLSWRGGNLMFRGEPLARALAEVERYTPVEFVIMDENLKTIRIGGLFKSGDVDGLLKTLRQNFDIAYERVGDKKIVLSSIQ